MAEFKEVIRKKGEICNYYECCSDCPLNFLDCDRVELKHADRTEEIIMNWGKPIDWSKVAVDTKILVRDFASDDWTRRYFAKYENGKVYAFCGDGTSWSSGVAMPWVYAKLWEGEDDAEND